MMNNFPIKQIILEMLIYLSKLCSKFCSAKNPNPPIS